MFYSITFNFYLVPDFTSTVLQPLFLIGQAAPSNEIKFYNEFKQHRDILKSSIEEGYKMLSFKTYTGFIWIKWLVLQLLINIDKQLLNKWVCLCFWCIDVASVRTAFTWFIQIHDTIPQLI